MAAPPKLTPEDLTGDELEQIVRNILNIMYPDGDTGREWTSDELSDIASTLNDYHLVH